MLGSSLIFLYTNISTVKLRCICSVPRDISYYSKCMLCGAHACRYYLLVLQNVVGNAILLTTCARLIDSSFRSTRYKGLGSPITSSQPLFKLRMRDLERVWARFGLLLSLQGMFKYGLYKVKPAILLPTPDQSKRH